MSCYDDDGERIDDEDHDDTDRCEVDGCDNPVRCGVLGMCDECQQLEWENEDD